MKDKPNTWHLTTQNVINKVINTLKNMPLLGFEPTIPILQWQKTYRPYSMAQTLGLARKFSVKEAD